MLDHISLRVQDYDKTLAFYKAALAPIGYSVIMEFPGFAGLGEKGKPDFWITKSDKGCNPTHVAFRADRGRVDAFHAAALAAGGTDDGAPGVREMYHPNYYGAFVLDPEGNHVETCCHEPPGAKFADTINAATARLKAAGRKIKEAVKGKGKPATAKSSVAAVKKAAGKAAGTAKKAAGTAKKAAGKAQAAAKGRVAQVKKAAGKASGAARAKVKSATKKR